MGMIEMVALLRRAAKALSKSRLKGDQKLAKEIDEELEDPVEKEDEDGPAPLGLDPGDLFDATVEWYKEWLVISGNDAVLLTAVTGFSHVADSWPARPLFLIWSDGAGSGKSRALEMLRESSIRVSAILGPDSTSASLRRMEGMRVFLDDIHDNHKDPDGFRTLMRNVYAEKYATSLCVPGEREGDGNDGYSTAEKTAAFFLAMTSVGTNWLDNKEVRSRTIMMKMKPPPKGVEAPHSWDTPECLVQADWKAWGEKYRELFWDVKTNNRRIDTDLTFATDRDKNNFAPLLLVGRACDRQEVVERAIAACIKARPGTPLGDKEKAVEGLPELVWGMFVDRGRPDHIRTDALDGEIVQLKGYGAIISDQVLQTRRTEALESVGISVYRRRVKRAGSSGNGKMTRMILREEIEAMARKHDLYTDRDGGEEKRRAKEHDEGEDRVAFIEGMDAA